MRKIETKYGNNEVADCNNFSHINITWSDSFVDIEHIKYFILCVLDVLYLMCAWFISCALVVFELCSNVNDGVNCEMMSPKEDCLFYV